MNTVPSWEGSNPDNRKGNQPWMFIGRIDAEAEAPVLWPPDASSQLTWKDPDAGRDWGREENGIAEDEMVGWQHRLNGHEFEQTLGDGEEQGRLVCCSPWGCKKLDTAEWMNNNNKSETGYLVLKYLPPQKRPTNYKMGNFTVEKPRSGTIIK